MDILSVIKHRIKNFYISYKNIIQYQHRIINEQYLAPEKTTVFTVKTIGVNVLPRYPASELANDDEILKNFHPSDIKRIIKAYFADNEIYLLDNTKYKVISKTINHGKVIFTILSLNNGYSKKMTPHDIVQNKEILLSLPKEDITDICLAAGLEHSQRETDSIKSNKESDNIIRLVANTNKDCAN
jgi:hypothetical protein